MEDGQTVNQPVIIRNGSYKNWMLSIAGFIILGLCAVVWFGVQDFFDTRKALVDGIERNRQSINTLEGNYKSDIRLVLYRLDSIDESLKRIEGRDKSE